MKIRFAAVLPALILAGCSSQYLERKDKVTFGAGDAVAWNSVQQVADPMPRRAQNTNIATNGEKAVKAVRQYIAGQPQAAGGGQATDNGGGGQGVPAH